jgi:hypothetical protein
MLIITVLLFVPSGVHAADNGVLPYTFSSGTPAKASEVNQNFNYVNYGNLVLIDGTGAELGTFIASESFYWRYMNKNGYSVRLVPSNPVTTTTVVIAGESTYYATSNCTGSAYISTGSSGLSPFRVFPGIIWSTNGSLYYLPKNAGLPASFTYNSVSFVNQGCQLSSGTCGDCYNAFINDPSVTGESSITKTLPLRIIRRTP